MTIVIFILVLVVLILVHELGHFIVAKLSGMRVDEFGIGYPPRALLIAKVKGTEYTLNWLPFGGFVKIFGEDSEEGSAKNPSSFGRRPRILQALVLIAGIAMNLFFAWVLISATLAIGTPRALDPAEIARAKDVSLAVASVLPGSPAQTAGLKAGDLIVSVANSDKTFSGADSAAFTSFIAQDTSSAPLSIVITRNDKNLTLLATPRTGIVAAEPSRPALGVAIAPVGTLSVPLWQAPIQGAQFTWEITKEIAVGLWHFFASIATFSADLSQVSGPIGIAGAVGGAAHNGIIALLSLTAVISINLALINLLPVPALDGGRLLFVLIEAITRKPIKSGVANAINTIGFGFLILLMVVVTAHDIFKLFT